MGLESTYKSNTTRLNEVDMAEITAFLNRKKGEVFWTLEKQEGLSNKELAIAVDTIALLKGRAEGVNDVII